MIRVALMIAGLPFVVPRTLFAGGGQEGLAEYGNAAMRLREAPGHDAWSCGHKQTVFLAGGTSKKPRQCSGVLPVETMVQAVPDQVAVLDFG